MELVNIEEEEKEKKHIEEKQKMMKVKIKQSVLYPKATDTPKNDLEDPKIFKKKKEP